MESSRAAVSTLISDEWMTLLVEKTGKQQPEQILRDGRHGALGWQIFSVEMVDAAGFGVGGDKLVGELGDGIHEKQSSMDRRHGQATL